MRRNPETGDPDFFGFARDYLHTYLPKVLRIELELRKLQRCHLVGRRV